MRGIHWVITLAALVLCACVRDSKNPEPPAGAQHALALEAAVDTPKVEPGSQQSVIARVRIAPAAQPGKQRPKVNLALVVDTSGSMQGRAIADATKASELLVDSLKDGDRLAVVSFDSSAEMLAASTELDGQSRADIKHKLEALRARGTTDMEAGLRMGIAQVSAHLDPQGVNRIVLLGDGIPNDESAITGMVQAAKSSGISITSLGLGSDYNESLMGNIAQLSGGKFHYVEDSGKVAGFFKDEIVRLGSVTAQNAELELVPGPGVSIERVIGQAAIPSGRRMRVTLGDVSHGDSREIYVKLTVKAQHDGANIELCDALLHYDVPGGARGEERFYLNAQATSSKSDRERAANSEIELGAAFAEAAAVTVEAINLARAGQRTRAVELLNLTAKELERISEIHKSEKLKQEAEALRGLATDLPPATVAAEAPRAGAMPAPAAELSAPAQKRLRAQHDAAIQRLQ